MFGFITKFNQFIFGFVTKIFDFMFGFITKGIVNIQIINHFKETSFKGYFSGQVENIMDKIFTNR